jgi:hypothetical protein
MKLPWPKRFAWIGGTGRRFAVLVGLLSTFVGVGFWVAKEGRYWAWIAIAGLLLLVVAVGWTAHGERAARLLAETRPIEPALGPPERPVQPAPETREEAARRLLEALAERGRQIIDMRLAGENLRRAWLAWQEDAQGLIEEMFGPRWRSEFDNARSPHSGDYASWLDLQVRCVETWLSNGLPPLLGSWLP